MDTVSILLPAHNEAKGIYANIGRVCATARELIAGPWRERVSAFEVVASDDGSTDGTRAEIDRACRDFQEVRAVYDEINHGKGQALRSAFAHAAGSLVFMIDGDLEIGPEHMRDLAELLDENVDAVLGSKRLGTATHRYPWWRKLVSHTYALVVRTLIPLPVRDTQTGFKLYRRKVLEKVFPRMLVRRYAFDIELLSIAQRLGFRFRACPVRVDFSSGRGSVTIKNIYHMLIDTLAVFYRLRLLKYYDSWEPKDYTYQPRISIVIAVKADNPYLRQSVTTTLKQQYPDFEIIVLPDESIGGYDERVRIIPTGNELPAIKRNMGAEAATGEIIAFIDDDAYPYRNWLRELAANFADESVGAVGGPGCTPPDDSYWQEVSGAVYASLAASGVYRYRYIVDRRREVDDYPTCNLAVRKSVFEAAQGFQTNFWPGEDTELCLTIARKLNKRIIYDPLVEVFHHRRSLWNGHFRQVTQYALHRGYFVKRFPETSLRLAYFVPTLFTIGSLTGWVTWWIWRPLFHLYVAVMVFYLLFVLASSFLAGPRLTLATTLGTILTHYGYGYCFLKGLLARKLSEQEEGAGGK